MEVEAVAGSELMNGGATLAEVMGDVFGDAEVNGPRAGREDDNVRDALRLGINVSSFLDPNKFEFAVTVESDGFVDNGTGGGADLRAAKTDDDGSSSAEGNDRGDDDDRASESGK